MIAQANNIKNEVSLIQSAIQATTISMNALDNMFCKIEPIGVDSQPTLVERKISNRNQMIAGACQQLDSVRVKLQAMLGNLDFNCQVAAEDVLKAVHLVHKADSFLRYKSRSQSL
jgi:hypothetical protein